MTSREGSLEQTLADGEDVAERETKLYCANQSRIGGRGWGRGQLGRATSRDQTQ